jgi:hypothetical protein
MVEASVAVKALLQGAVDSVAHCKTSSLFVPQCWRINRQIKQRDVILKHVKPFVVCYGSPARPELELVCLLY